ncbi:MAG: glycosyltransferase family 2 protein [Bacteroidota bacterium]
MPKVSVIIPMFNAERFLRSAVESVLGQTFADFECIIIDDGSTDSSEQIIRSYHDSRIKLLRNSNNLGITKSLNKGISESIGKYICRMDADDMCVPDRLLKQVTYLDSHLDVAVVGSWVILIDTQGRNIGTEQYPGSSADIMNQIFTHNPFAHSSVMIRRTVLDICGNYSANFLHNEDYDLWLRIAARFPVANIEEPLIMRRIHESNVTVMKETELVRYRIKTLAHAIFHYYHKPLYITYLLRPYFAYYMRLFKGVFQ